MNCHAHCAACCIAPEISSALPGMPRGKPAGVACINLDEHLRCRAYSQRPEVCRNFTAQADSCGTNHQDALKLIGLLEQATKP